MFSNQMSLIQLQSSISIEFRLVGVLFPSVWSFVSRLLTSHETTLHLAIEGYREHVFPHERLNNEFTLSILYTRTILIGNARQLDTIRIVSSIIPSVHIELRFIFVFSFFIHSVTISISIVPFSSSIHGVYQLISFRLQLIPPQSVS